MPMDLRRFRTAPVVSMTAFDHFSLPMIVRSARRFCAILLLLTLILGAHAQVSLTTISTPYTENFDTLPATGSATFTNNSTIPGWYAARTGTGTTIVANDGSNNGGNLYSYGTGTATDRAIGSLGSGNAAIGNLFWGVRLKNNTGVPITQLNISYTGEQWRNSAAAAQTLAFSYLIGSPNVTGTLAEFQAAGVAVPQLDFTTPVTGGAAGALNGNLAANRVAISFSITGISIPVGVEVMLRWADPDHTGADHGIAIDDFSVTPLSPPTPPALSISDVSQAEGDGSGTTTFTFSVTLSKPSSEDVFFNIRTNEGTAQDGSNFTEDNDFVPKSLINQVIPAGSTGPYNFDVLVNRDSVVEPNETFFVDISNVTSFEVVVADGQGQGTILNDDFVITPIHDIQGNGSVSPIVGQAVTARGIVTGLKSNGFFLQEPDASVDADPATSEGIFVFTSSAPPAAAVVGNSVRVQGTVAEFTPVTDPLQPPLTELTSPTVTLLTPGNPLPTAVTLTTTFPDPAGPVDQLERVESMRVAAPSFTATQPTAGTISETNATATSNGIFYGVVTGVPRPFREPGILAPDPAPAGSIPPIPRFDGNPELIRVDSDALGGALVDVSTGAVVTGLAGPLDYGVRAYTILPDASVTLNVSGGSIANTVTAPKPSEFTVATYNLGRFFDSVNDSSPSDVALTSTAFNNRLAKASFGIRNHLRSPDILGITDIENLSALQSLASKISTDAGLAGQPDPQYQTFLFPGTDDTGLDVGFLIKTAVVSGSTPRVEVISVIQEFTNYTLVRPDSSTEKAFERPPLRLNAIIHGVGTDFPITVILCQNRDLNAITDPGTGSFGYATIGEHVRHKRYVQADAIASLVQSRQSANAAERIVVMGDFGAYEFNDGLVDVLGVVAGTPAPDNQTAILGDGEDLVSPDLDDLFDTAPAAQRYGRVADGSAQNSDHLLVNAALSASTASRRIEYARINADYPETARNSSTDGIRTSDRDPVVAYFDVPNISITAVTGTAAEGTGVGTTPFQFTVARGDTTGSVTVNYAVTGADVTGADFGGTPPSGQVTIPAGQASTTITINATQDSMVEPAEQFTVTLSNATNGYIIGTPTATGTITNDDSAIVTLSGGGSIVEGNSSTAPLTYTATLSNPVQGGFTLAYSTSDGTATTGDNDYNDNDGTLTFAGIAGESHAIQVQVRGDNKVEADETFSVALGAVTNVFAGAAIDTAGALQTALITNDDSAVVALAGNASQPESSPLMGFSITLSNPVDAPVSVLFSTSDGTASDGFDYIGGTNVAVSFAAGSTTPQSLFVTLNDDSEHEADEVFNVTLSGLNNNGRSTVTLGTSIGTGTIVDDDTLTVGIAAVDNTADENAADAGTYRISRNTAVGNMTVNLQIDASSKATAADYTLSGGSISFSSLAPGSTGTVVIPDGASFVDVTLTPIDDIQAEAAETVQLNLTADAGYTLGSSANDTVTIAANDFVVTNTNDSGEGSLRQAVANADAGGGIPSTITFDPSVTGTITLTSGSFTLRFPTTIAGPGAKVLSISGNHQDRVFNINNGPVTLSGLTLRDGKPTEGSGGGAIKIFSTKQAPVNIVACAIVDNDARFTQNFFGGAIENQGATLTVRDCTIANNKGAALGGAIFSSGAGGGGGPDSGSTTLLNSTLTGNLSAILGGGINARNPVQITNCTIVGNTAGANGGNLYTDTDGSYALANTIVAGGAASNGPDLFGTPTSIHYCLIENISGFTAPPGASNNITGQSPNLGPLADNGGPTQTILPNPGSPVINAGSTPAALSEQQAITLVGAGGGFRLTFAGQTTSAVLPFNAIPEAVQPALESLSTIGVGNVAVARSGNTIVIRFQGALAGSDQPQITAQTNGDPKTYPFTLVEGGPVANDQRGEGFTRVQGPLADIGALEVNREILVEQPAGTSLEDGIAEIDFGTIDLGQSATKTFTVRNGGGLALHLTNASVTGGNAGEFAVDTTGLQTTLESNEFTTFTVTFTPGAATPRQTTLRIVNDDDDEATFDLTLKGTGNTLPVITLPTVLPIVVEAEDNTGATVNFTVTAHDAEDGVLTPMVNPASGSRFVVGDTPVAVSVKDSNNAEVTANFIVRVTDQTGPVISVPGTITMEATAHLTPVTFDVSATDSVDGPVTANANPASGSGFPVGDNTVQVTAMDSRSNPSSSSFHVIIEDTIAPVLSEADDIFITASSVSGVAVTFDLPTAMDATNTTVTSFPPSGHVFPVGTTSVRVTAVDEGGNTDTTNFNVTVSLDQPLSTVVFVTGQPVVTIPSAPGQPPADAKWTTFGQPAIDINGGYLALTANFSSPTTGKGSGLFSNYGCIATVGSEAPGGAGTLKTFSEPVIDNGYVASIVTLAGVPKPTASAIFTTRLNLVSADAIIGGPIVLPPSSPNAILVRSGDVATPDGATFKSFKSVEVRNEVIVFTATLNLGSGTPKTTAATDTGVWIITGSTAPVLIFREGQMVEGRKIKTLTSLDSSAGSRGQGRGWLVVTGPTPRVQARVVFTDKTQAVLNADLVEGVPQLTTLLQSDIAFSGGFLLTGGFGLPATTRFGEHALLGTLSSDRGPAPAIFFSPNGVDFDLLAYRTQIALSSGAKFSKLQDPVLATDGGLAFAATLTGGGVKGATINTLWWKPPGGELSLFAQAGIPQPGSPGLRTPIPTIGAPTDLPAGAQFSAFTSLAIAANRGPIFTATLVPGKDGIAKTATSAVFGLDGTGRIRRLFGVTDPIDLGNSVTKPLKSFTLLTPTVGNTGVTRSINDVQQITWRATFADKTQAIVVTQVP